MKHLLTLKVAALIALPLAISTNLRAQSNVVLSGRTYDVETNGPIPGLAIVAVRAPEATSARPAVFRTATDVSGAFSLSVTPGKYRICTEEGHMYLDPCQWPSPAGSAVNVANATHVDLSLKRGVFLTVHFHDPNAILASVGAVDSVTAKIPGPPVSVSFIDTAGILRVVPFDATRAGVSQFKVLVPQSSSIVLSIGGSKLMLADSTGKAVTPSAYRLPLDIPAAASFNGPTQPSIGFLHRPLIPSVNVHFTIMGASP